MSAKKELAVLVTALGFLLWSAWLICNGSHFLFMVPMGVAVVLAEGLDDSDSGDCDPCMGA